MAQPRSEPKQLNHSYEDCIEKLECNDASVRTLSFSERNPVSDLCRLFKALKRNTHVASLKVEMLPLSDEVCSEIGGMLEENQHLLFLQLAYGRIGAVGAGHIAKALGKNKTLQYLWLTANSNVGDTVCQGLKENHTLKYLNLELTKVTPVGIRALATHLAHPQCSLRGLSLHGNPEIGDEGAKILAAGIDANLESLAQLIITQCSISTTGLLALAPAIADGNLSLFRANTNTKFGSEGALVIADILSKNTSLLEVDVSACGFDDAGLVAIAQSVAKHPRLVLFQASLNSKLTKEAVYAFLPVVQENGRLAKIDLGSSISDIDQGIVEAALASNKTLGAFNAGKLPQSLRREVSSRQSEVYFKVVRNAEPLPDEEMQALFASRDFPLVHATMSSCESWLTEAASYRNWASLRTMLTSVPELHSQLFLGCVEQEVLAHHMDDPESGAILEAISSTAAAYCKGLVRQESMSRRLWRLHGYISELEHECLSARSTIVSLEKLGQASEKIEKELQLMRQKKEAAEKEAQAANQQQKSSQWEKERAETRAQALKTESETLRKEKERLEVEMRSLQKEKGSAEAEARAMRAEKERLEDQVQLARQQQEKAEEGAQSLRKEKERAEAEAQEAARRQHEASKAEVESLRKEKERLDTEAQNLRNENRQAHQRAQEDATAAASNKKSIAAGALGLFVGVLMGAVLLKATTAK